MEALVKTVSKFVARDLLYVLAGTSVILSYLYAIGIDFKGTIPVFMQMYYAGIAYIIGYVLQEIFSLSPFLTTSHFKPNSFLIWVYRRFTNDEFVYDPSLTSIVAFSEIYPSILDTKRDQIERIIVLKHVGATVGPSAIVSGSFFSGCALIEPSIINVFMSIATLGVGVILIILAWLKGMQQMHYFYMLKHSMRDEL